VPIRTERLDLLSGTTPVLDAGLKGRAALSQILDIEISKPWPPPLYDAHTISWILGRLQDDEVFEKWGFRYFVRRQESGRGVAVGAGGFKGPPSADGRVEIGYSVRPEFQRHGFATEAARGLLQRAYGDPGGRVRRGRDPERPRSVDRCTAQDRVRASGRWLRGGRDSLRAQDAIGHVTAARGGCARRDVTQI